MLGNESRRQRRKRRRVQWQCLMARSRFFRAKNKAAGTSRPERRKGFEAQAGRSGLARETWALQATPMESFMLVWFEAP